MAVSPQLVLPIKFREEEVPVMGELDGRAYKTLSKK